MICYISYDILYMIYYIMIYYMIECYSIYHMIHYVLYIILWYMICLNVLLCIVWYIIHCISFYEILYNYLIFYISCDILCIIHSRMSVTIINAPESFANICKNANLQIKMFCNVYRYISRKSKEPKSARNIFVNF